MRASVEQQTRFRDLYDDAYLDVLRFVQRRTQPSHAEDVVAETFLVVWRRMDAAPARACDLRAWLFGIARNLLLNERRGGRRREALAVKIADHAQLAHPPSDLDGIPFQLDLAHAWRRLDAGDQEVLSLAVFDDLTSPQAAIVLGITSAAYRLRLMRARRELRHLLQAPDTGPRDGSPSTTSLQERTS